MAKPRNIYRIAALTVAAAAMLPLGAQEFRATITGRVSDPTGAGVSNAKVVAKNVSTNEEISGVTATEGNYTVPFLKPGDYSVVVEATGFKRAVRENIQLFVNDKTTLDFTLQVGDVAESVTVSDVAPLLDEATASRGGVIENLRITELPLNGRNPFMLAGLTTGVQFAGNPVFTRPFDNGDNIAWSINGGLRQTNEFLLDGAPDDAVTDADGGRTRSQNNIAFIPSVDATQEFKILTNFYDAQYGRTGGGVFNVLTKSGTNALHGSAYEFLRRYQLDANDHGSNAAGRPRYARDPITGENLGGKVLDQYGGVLTGPVVLPKIYNGKNKTFFMFGYEKYREDVPEPALGSVPTLRERQGDFSQSGIAIYDPFSTRENPAFNSGLAESANNPRYIRDQFPSNMIPANRLNPVGLNIARAYPEPNVGGADLRFNNFLAAPNLSIDRFYSVIGRVDHNFGEKQRLFVRWATNNRDQTNSGNGFEGLGADRQDPFNRNNQNAVVDSLTVLSPTTILNLRGSLTRYLQAAFRRRVQGFDATQFGFPASFSAARPTAITPRVEAEQYTNFGSRNPNQNTTNTIALQGSLSHIRGAHSIKAGAEFRDIRVNVLGGSFVWGGGQFTLNREFTRRLPQFADATSGSAIASLLLGTPSGGQVEYTPTLAYRWPYYALYFQDDWKVTNRLSLNLGLRWDTEMAPTERYDRMNRGFAFGQASPIAAQVRSASGATECPACANLTGGLLFVSDGDRAAFANDNNNWQPRIGAAYQLTSKTVLRGGYGIFYLPQANYGGSIGFGIVSPFVSTVGGGAAAFTPATTLSNPFPNGLTNPTNASLGLGTNLGGDIRFNDPNRKIPYTHQYSFGIQHQLPWAMKVDTSYVGSRTKGINTGDFNAGNARNINVPTVEQLARARQDSNYFNQSVANPLMGLIPNNRTLNASTISRRQLLLPYPQFTNVFIGNENIGELTYDAWQTNIEKRFSGGLVFVVAHTWSKNLEAISFLNDQDTTPVRNLTSWDRTQRLVLSGVWQLPFGSGRAIGKTTGRGLNYLIGGWEYNWIATFQSGTPLDLPGNVDLIGNPETGGDNYNQWFNGCVLQPNGTAREPNAAHSGFDTCTNPTWSIRGPNTLRTIPFRSGQIRTPWAKQYDMSFNKKFLFTESVNAQLRFEAFNIFNTPIRPGPNTDPTSQNFGLVSNGQRNFPRNIQLGFKLNF